MALLTNENKKEYNPPFFEPGSLVMLDYDLFNNTNNVHVFGLILSVFLDNGYHMHHVLVGEKLYLCTRRCLVAKVNI